MVGDSCEFYIGSRRCCNFASVHDVSILLTEVAVVTRRRVAITSRARVWTANASPL